MDIETELKLEIKSHAETHTTVFRLRKRIEELEAENARLGGLLENMRREYLRVVDEEDSEQGACQEERSDGGENKDKEARDERI